MPKETMKFRVGQGFGERVCKVVLGVDLSNGNDRLSLMFPDKMIRQSNRLFVQTAARVSRIQYNRHVVDPNGGRLAYFYAH